jgi:hypothetical protein
MPNAVKGLLKVDETEVARFIVLRVPSKSKLPSNFFDLLVNSSCLAPFTASPCVFTLVTEPFLPVSFCFRFDFSHLKVVFLSYVIALSHFQFGFQFFALVIEFKNFICYPFRLFLKPVLSQALLRCSMDTILN